MIKRILKYAMLFLLLLVVLLMLTFFVVWHTKSGSRFAINQGIKYSEQDVSFAEIEGTLASGLVINDFKYSSQGIEIIANKLEYTSDWQFFKRHLILDQFSIEQLSITTKQVEQANTDGEPFSGIELPLSISIRTLDVNQLQLNLPAQTQIIERINLIAELGRQNATIQSLSVESDLANFTIDGDISYFQNLTYAVEALWQLQPKTPVISGSGAVSGDLNTVTVAQQMQVDDGVVQTELQLGGDIKNLNNEPIFELDLQAPQTTVKQGRGTLIINQLAASVKGPLSAYQVELNAALSHEQLPPTQVALLANGNLDGVRTESANIITPDGQIKLQSQLNWQDEVRLNNQLEVIDFNPEQLISGWSGLINGSVDISAHLAGEKTAVNITNNRLKGQLKDLPFAVTGNLQLDSENVSAEDFLMMYGNNKVTLNGLLNKQMADLSGTIELNDLAAIDARLGGAVKSDVSIKGNPLSPDFKFTADANVLRFKGYELGQLNAQSQGLWGQSISSKVNARNIDMNGQSITSININQTGWLDDHQIAVELTEDWLRNKLSINGGFTSTGPWHWLGELQQHEITFKDQHQLTLQQAVAIKITDELVIAPACWQDKASGSLCLSVQSERASAQTTVDLIKGQIAIEDFDLQPINALLPKGINLTGFLAGIVDYDYHDGALQLSSDLRLADGSIAVNEGEKEVYRTDITQFNIKASTSQRETQLSLVSQLADESFITVNAGLEHAANQTWLMTADVDGLFTSTRLIQELSDEISEINGRLIIKGQVNGDMFEPIININVSQPDGYIKLNRLGTVVENLMLQINTQGIKQPIYQINLSAQNLAEIKQGNISTEGRLQVTEGGWDYQGQISGDDFMIINLPELKFNVSPELAIIADEQNMSIKGQVDVDYGHVIVKQLPASSISNSGDLVIVEAEQETISDYPVILDIKANINNPIELDVIGLDAFLDGSIQLTQSATQSLRGFGALTLVDGSYEIYGQKLTIETGNLMFNGPLENPRLNVKASRQSLDGDVTAGVELGGTVDNLQSNLFSVPELPDIEKLSYIMTGRGVENAGNINGEQLKQTAIIMGLNQSSPLFNQIQTQFGIDVLTVRESSFAKDTVVEAGKKINDRLYVSYNQGLFSRLGFWILKYKINEYLNLQSTQGENQAMELVYTRKAELPKKKAQSSSRED
ncbi:translocation/assembly module TamB domain-containing protein [Marinicella sp. S1101]|uniref:translocation/assembly module TamB domain-containing protein n=1 Tax=Marinicella marina TaxID=2996016 RepID=UPI002260BAD1|nr:translocation/assembly module TamB domain-containing protein [Marinicella marina]MCX7554179.1 translocation/assembly module TamB domain-containing protein [Marinicella marina]MDJ1141128.1 translocation/assembly module TamB domain-containing protein [Marinicella marina]